MTKAGTRGVGVLGRIDHFTIARLAAGGGGGEDVAADPP